MLKTFSLFGLTALSLFYAIGFIYDSAYIESFGVDFHQLFGSPAEYLAVGGILLLQGAVKWFTILFLSSGLLACSIVPVREELGKRKLRFSEYVDLKSLPLIVGSVLLVVLIIYPGLIVGVAQRDAEKDIKMYRSRKQAIHYKKGDKWISSNGVLLRNRNGLALIYDAEQRAGLLVPTGCILIGSNKP